LPWNVGFRSTFMTAHNPKVVGSNPTSATNSQAIHRFVPEDMNKRKRVAIDKHRKKKRKLKARQQAAR
jgi:hypothetical protein